MQNYNDHISLIWLSQEVKPPKWPLGAVYTSSPNPRSLQQSIGRHLEGSEAVAWLFWDPDLGYPPTNLIKSCLNSKVDIWHAGLKLGLSGKPELIDSVYPTWMLNRDPDPDKEATSWRLSLRACLIRSKVLHQLGGPTSQFETLAGAGLELGYRYIRYGAIMRHLPELLPEHLKQSLVQVPLRDQLRFIEAGFGHRWLAWVTLRTVLNGVANPLIIYRNLQMILRDPLFTERKPYERGPIPSKNDNQTAKVTVLIPTINRYSFLNTLVNQLRNQTISPYEILIVDQTPERERDLTLIEYYRDLPIRMFYLNQAGQCRSRNFGLNHARGNFILFLDDDVEIPPTLIEDHLRNLANYQNKVSSGVVYEKDIGPLPEDFRFKRISNVFPAGNSLIKRDVLYDTGLFDMAYDHGQRADGDLGMRLYLSGNLMMLDPSISILHHRAPTGGLREHKARINTYGNSRKHLLKQNLPTPSDIYLTKRYLTNQQIKEFLWISVMGTLSLKGAMWKRIIKFLVSFIRLPYTLLVIRKRSKKAEEMLKVYPRIPQFNPEDE